MKKLLLALLVSSAAMVTAPVMAVTLSASSLNGNTYTDYSTEGLLAFDLDARNSEEISFALNFSAAEISFGSVDFNAVVNNFIASGIPGLHFEFGFAPITIGTAHSAFTTGAKGVFSIAQDEDTFFVHNLAASREHFGVLIGNPYGTAGKRDWQIDTSDLSADVVYAFSVQAVPEPGSLALLCAGLGVMGVTARRRKARK